MRAGYWGPWVVLGPMLFACTGPRVGTSVPRGAGGSAAAGAATASGGTPTAAGGYGANGDAGSTGFGGSSGAAQVCPGEDCDPEILVGYDATVDFNELIYSGAALDEGRIYYGVKLTNPFGSAIVQLRSVPKNGGAWTVLSGPDERDAGSLPLAVDEAYVYWFSATLNEQGVHLRRALKDGSGTPEVLLTLVSTDTWSPPGADGYAMAVDEKRVYWLADPDDRFPALYGYPKNQLGGTSAELLKSLQSSSGFALPVAALEVGGGWAYWAMGAPWDDSVGSGEVWRLGVGDANAGEELRLSAGPIEGGARTCDLARVGTTLYSSQCTPPYEVHAIAMDGTRDELVASARSETTPVRFDYQYSSLAVDATDGYLLTQRFVYRFRPGNPTPTVLGGTSIWDVSRDELGRNIDVEAIIGIDAARVYLLDTDEGYILTLHR